MSFDEWMANFEFDIPDNIFGVSNTAKFNALMSQDEWHGIEDAAMLAFGGLDEEAEAARERAGYGGLR